ncbi:hypothetical protein J2W30_003673 [Variovorax boronicumulans]|uniref:hypothetical protein n=1 Tax=Variovorax boronicumulans TaxID=436515 RepID=UPI002786A7CD|nr:hypothetical protein [Variovorax boronicumulans]MDQ0035900.1 hypothetical protein [Variovorax boronicumulans]
MHSIFSKAWGSVKAWFAAPAANGEAITREEVEALIAASEKRMRALISRLKTYGGGL